MTTQHTQQPLTAQGTSPDLIKKVEKEIMKEAQREEKNLKHAVNDLTHTEKAESKAYKTASKAEKGLNKAEKSEQSTLKKLQKTEHSHDVALTNVHKAQNNLESSAKQHGKIQHDLQTKKASVDAAMKAHDQHTQERNAKLQALHGPEADSEAARIVPQTLGKN